MPQEVLHALSIFPPWVVASMLLGVASGALAFSLVGPRLLSLPLYVVLGALAALLGQMGSLALDLTPWPVAFGQVHLLAIAAASAVFLSLARLYRL